MGWPRWCVQQDIQPLSMGSCLYSAVRDAEREMRGARRSPSGLINAPSITSELETIVMASSGSVQHRFGRNQHLFLPVPSSDRDEQLHRGRVPLQWGRRGQRGCIELGPRNKHDLSAYHTSLEPHGITSAADSVQCRTPCRAAYLFTFFF